MSTWKWPCTQGTRGMSRNICGCNTGSAFGIEWVGPRMLLSTYYAQNSPTPERQTWSGCKRYGGETWSRWVSERAKALKCAGQEPVGSDLRPLMLGSEPCCSLTPSLPISLMSYQAPPVKATFPPLHLLVTCGTAESCAFLTLLFCGPRAKPVLALRAPRERWWFPRRTITAPGHCFLPL